MKRKRCFASSFWSPAARVGRFAAAAPRTMRVDYYHTGNASEERFSLDRVVLEPLAWPGNPDRPVDDTNLGKYFFEVDRPRNRTASSTRAASPPSTASGRRRARRRSCSRTFHESLRFPAPERPVQIVLKKRDAAERVPRGLDARASTRRTSSSTRSTRRRPGPLLAIQKHGDPAEKVDFLILGDGYTAAERGKFEKDARRLAEILFATRRSRSAARDFNVWGALPGRRGVGHLAALDRHPPPLAARRDLRRVRLRALRPDLREPRASATSRRSPLRVRRDPGQHPDLRRRRHLRPLLRRSPPTALWAPYVFVHEFGHHFAGLADEYYTSAVAYEPAAEPRRALGAERDGAARPGGAQVEGPRLAGHADSRRPGRRRRSRRRRAEIQERRRQIRAENAARGGDGRALPRGAGARDEAPRQRAATPARSAPSRARCTRPRATTGPRWTASCSPATRCPSAPSAGAPSTRVIDLYTAGDRAGSR